VPDHDVPEHARAALSAITDRLDELRTQRIRFTAAAAAVNAELAARPRPDPAETLRAAAADRDAPADLVRVARAVREGRTTWQAIAAGAANSVPEVAAFQTRMKAELARFVDSLPDLRPADPPRDVGLDEAPTPPRRARRSAPRDDDGEDEVPIEWLRR
jgi:hypothetical protein